MKKFIIITLIVLGYSIISFAEDMPEYMKDGTIVVTLKNGKSYSFSTNEYKVVKRGQEKAEAAVTLAKEEAPKEQNKNRLRFMGGSAPDGFDKTVDGNTVIVTTRNKPVVGIGYDRLITEGVSIGGAVLSNGTYTLGIGTDF